MFDLKLLMNVLDCGGAAGRTELFCCFCLCTSSSRGIVVDRENQKPAQLQNIKREVEEALKSGKDPLEILKSYEPLKHSVGRPV